jgi:hypothetical protein
MRAFTILHYSQIIQLLAESYPPERWGFKPLKEADELTLPPELFPRPGQNAIIPLSQNDPRVTPQFAAQGLMHQAVGLIWSGVPSEAMKRDAAVQFCQSLGGGARLPTVEEWEALTRIMNGNFEALPGISGKYFWSSGAANAFNFRSGGVPYPRDCRDAIFAVRCVVPAQ